MRNLFKVLMLCLTIGIILLPMTDVFAQVTPSGTAVDNEAYVSGDNFDNKTNTASTTVERIIGAAWSSGPDVSPAVGGTSYSNLSYLTNLGNTNFNFRITVDQAVTDVAAGPVAGWWAYEVFTNDVLYLNVPAGDTSAQGGSIPLASGSVVDVKIKVAVSAGAFGGWQRWRMSADTLETHNNSQVYTGDNAVQYGGPTDLGWGESNPGGDDFVTTWDGIDRFFQITVAAPIMVITKTIRGIATTSVDAPDGIAIPGATITYVVRISNGGTVAANNVVIYDTFDNVNTTFVAASATATNVVNNAGNTWATSEAGGVVKMTNDGDTAFDGGDVAFLTFQVTIN